MELISSPQFQANHHPDFWFEAQATQYECGDFVCHVGSVVTLVVIWERFKIDPSTPVPEWYSAPGPTPVTSTAGDGVATYS